MDVGYDVMAFLSSSSAHLCPFMISREREKEKKRERLNLDRLISQRVANETALKRC